MVVADISRIKIKSAAYVGAQHPFPEFALVPHGPFDNSWHLTVSKIGGREAVLVPLSWH